VSDEDWIGLGALERDADYFERVFLIPESICSL
jgi:hypothetical protein